MSEQQQQQQQQPLWTSQYVQEIVQCGRELCTIITQVMHSGKNAEKLGELYEDLNTKSSAMAQLCTTQLRDVNNANKPSGIFIPEDKLVQIERANTDFLINVGEAESAIKAQQQRILYGSDVIITTGVDDDDDDDVNTTTVFQEKPKALIESLKRLLLTASQATKIQPMTSQQSSSPRPAKINLTSNSSFANTIQLRGIHRRSSSNSSFTPPPPGSPHSEGSPRSRSPAQTLKTVRVGGGMSVDVAEVRKQNTNVEDILSECLSILGEEELDVIRIKELVKPLYTAYQELYRSGEEHCSPNTIGDFRNACTQLFGLIKMVLDTTDDQAVRDKCIGAARAMIDASEKVTSEILMAADDASQGFDTMSTASGWDDTDAATLTIIREKDDEIKRLNKIIVQRDAEMRRMKSEFAAAAASSSEVLLKTSSSGGGGGGDDDNDAASISKEKAEIEQLRADLNDKMQKLESDKAKIRAAVEKISAHRRLNEETLSSIREERAQVEAQTKELSKLMDAAHKLSPECFAADTVAALCDLIPEFQALWDAAPTKTKERYTRNIKKIIIKSSGSGSSSSSSDSSGNRRSKSKRSKSRSRSRSRSRSVSCNDDDNDNNNHQKPPITTITITSEEEKRKVNAEATNEGVSTESSFKEDETTTTVTITIPNNNNSNNATIKQSNEGAAKVLEGEGDDLDMIISAQASFTETFKKLCSDKGNSTALVDWSRMNTELELFKATLLKHATQKDDALKSASYRDKVVHKAAEMSALIIRALTEAMALLALSPAEAAAKALQASTDLERGLEDARQCFVDLFRAVVEDVKGFHAFDSVVKVSEKLVTEIGKVSLSAAPKASLVEAGGRSDHLREKIFLELVAAISDASVQLVKVSTQIMSVVCNLPFTSLDDKSTTPLWELSAWGHRLVALLGEVGPRFETARVLMVVSEPHNDNNNGSADVVVESGDEGSSGGSGVGLWDEILGRKKTPASTFVEIGVPQYVSLNKLIDIITNPDEIYNATIKAAVSTALSFAEPQAFLSKLIERFNVPEDVVNIDGMAARIKNRVCIALQHYIDAQFEDFDERTLRALRDFVSGPLTAFNKSFGTVLRNDVDRRERVARQRLLVSQIPSTNVAVYAGSRPLLDLFMSTDTVAIAQQLTLISASIYASIKPKELLDLAWSKPKLQYRAPNVIHFQERTALLSQFVAILTVSRPTPEDRKEALEKVLDVMAQLLKYNNFNDLMALYAGFANAAVNRLNASKALIDPKRLKFLKHCDKLLAPMGSFKHYRHAITEAGYGSVPILSVALSDLTFIDEGNPDTMNGDLINFEKRFLVHNKILALQKYQTFLPQFIISEPLYSALWALPSCSEGVLYDFSLVREPRKPANASPQPAGRIKSRKF